MSINSVQIVEQCYVKGFGVLDDGQIVIEDSIGARGANVRFLTYSELIKEVTTIIKENPHLEHEQAINRNFYLNKPLPELTYAELLIEFKTMLVENPNIKNEKALIRFGDEYSFRLSTVKGLKVLQTGEVAIGNAWYNRRPVID